MQQITGVFADAESAERAIAALEDHGVTGDELSVVRSSDGKGLANIEEHGSHGISVTTVEDATAGALKGGAAGIALGVLAGAVVLAIPGAGLVLAAGPLWAAFGAAAATGAAGAALGGVVGYLVDQGVPHDAAHTYAEALGRGDILLSVHTRHMNAGDVHGLLEKYGATDLGAHEPNVVTESDASVPVSRFADIEEDRAHTVTPAPVAIAEVLPIQDALTQDALAQEARDQDPDAVPLTLSPITPSLPLMPGPIGR